MGFKPCEFRARTEEGWVCQAAGGAPIETLRSGGEPVEAVCARCTVPEELAHRPCLFMVPVRVREGETVHDFFGCPWYHSVSRLEFQRDTSLCAGCRDWFPRPPIELQPRYAERTRRMIRFFADALAGRVPPPRFALPPPAPAPPPPRRGWMSRLLPGGRRPSHGSRAR